MGSRRWIWTAVAAVLLVACSSKGGVVSQTRSAGENTISCINDGSVDWTGIKTVYLYGDGCAVPPTCTIRDEETISQLVEQVQQTGEYQEVSRSEYLEGMNLTMASASVCTGRKIMEPSRKRRRRPGNRHFTASRRNFVKQFRRCWSHQIKRSVYLRLDSIRWRE